MEYENSTKKHIREVALKLFNEKTFEKVTLKEICEASGVNKHTFYYYFKSKDELLKKYYKIPCELTSYDLATIMTADSYIEQLWIINKNFIDFISDSGVSIIKQLMIKNITDHIGTFKHNDEQKELFKLQCDIVRKGQKNNEFLNKTDPEVLVIILKQTLFSTIGSWIFKNGEFDYRKAVRFMFEMILDVDEKYREEKDFSVSSMWE